MSLLASTRLSAPSGAARLLQQRQAGRASLALPRRAAVVRAIAVPEAPRLEDDDNLDMFCYQCEQTVNAEACTTRGVCGKTPETAMLQDLLTYSLKTLSCWAHYADQQGVAVPHDVYSFLHAGTFATLTNVNFDDERFKSYVIRAHELRARIEALLKDAGVTAPPPAPANLPWFDLLAHPALWHPDPAFLHDATIPQLVELGRMTSLEHRRHRVEPTLLGLQECVNYALRGLGAYTHHAEVLGFTDPKVDKFVAEAYAFLCSQEAASVDNVLGYVLKCGEANLWAMELLDKANTTKYGDPVPTPVRITPVKGKAILVSGHDLQDLHDLCEQTVGTGINIYTHGELLPAHGYPVLKQKFPHLVGNYGGAWYRQQREFAEFPGSILMTTNCIIAPRETYKGRIFTTGEVGWQDVAHVEGGMGQKKDYSQVIQAALDLPGFAFEPEEPKFVTTGFAHNAVLGVAGKVVEAVQTGQLKHIFLIGGCDGTQPERKYFTQVADSTPNDTMVLTLGCGKYRFYDHDMGELGDTGLPRLLDMGQCNDAYSAIVVASKLAEAFGTDVNGLPLSLDLSWLEQKAVAILCTLLFLGVKNVRIGPHAPAFLTPEALAVLVEKYQLKVSNTKDPEGDLQAMLANA